MRETNTELTAKLALRDQQLLNYIDALARSKANFTDAIAKARDEALAIKRQLTWAFKTRDEALIYSAKAQREIELLKAQVRVAYERGDSWKAAAFQGDQKLKDDLIAANGREATVRRELRWAESRISRKNENILRLEARTRITQEIQRERDRLRQELAHALGAAEIERDRYLGLKSRVDAAHKLATGVAGALA
jgi:hypothetical protein